MKMKHTPGPWRLIRNQFSEYCSTEFCEMAIMSGGDMNMIVAGVVSDCIEEHQSNARLIAAAPELLEALKRIHMRLEAYHDSEQEMPVDSLFVCLDAARAAIHKATGEEA